MGYCIIIEGECPASNDALKCAGHTCPEGKGRVMDEKRQCSNCLWYQMRWQQCLKTGMPTSKLRTCHEWRDINEGENE